MAKDPRFAVETVSPQHFPQAIEKQIRRGAKRILVAGGDGTLSTAARVLLPHPVELAVIPAGTYNHFAKSLGIPADISRAVEIAAGNETRGVDVGMVNDCLFLNTSSVGAYVRLVNHRERLQPYLGKSLAGTVAAMELMLRLDRFGLELDLAEHRRRYRTPLLFVGVGERDLRMSCFGERIDGTGPGLHVIVLRGNGRMRLLSIALATAAYGIWRAARTPHVDSFLVEHCSATPQGGITEIALDGELHPMQKPLRYSILRKALTVVVPPQIPSNEAGR